MPLQVKAKTKAEDKHSADVNTLVYRNGVLYSGADDGKIIMWDADLNKLKEVQAHPTTVYCLAYGNGTLYSCSNDGALYSWDPNTLEQKLKILQVENELYRLAFSDGVLYSCDDQGNIRSHADNVVKGIYALLEPLRELIVHDKCIYTVRDLDLVLTEMKGDKLFEIRATFPGRAPMCLLGDKVCFSSRSGKDIVVGDGVSPYKHVCEVKDAHELVINALTGTSNGTNCLYSGSWDKLVKQWKIEDGVLNLANSVDVGVVINVMTSGEGGIIYAGCGDGSIVRVDS